MEHKQNARPEAPADESASSSHPPADSDSSLLSDCLSDEFSASLEGTLDETFPPGGRRPRLDGWTGERIGAFLRDLAATGVVEHAARAAGLSVASAYNFRNARRGRAFARMWDAVMIHRARARIAAEAQGRAVAGCVSVRKRDGVVVSEYHYYDNRLTMSLLARLDRIAEREEASEAHLRALSEDLDDYIDCVEADGDADAFVEARRPSEPEPEPPEPRPDPAAGLDETREPDTDLTAFARAAGCRDRRGARQPPDLRSRPAPPG